MMEEFNLIEMEPIEESMTLEQILFHVTQLEMKLNAVRAKYEASREKDPEQERIGEAVKEALILFVATENRFVKFLCGGEFIDRYLYDVEGVLERKKGNRMCPKLLAMWEKYKDFWPMQDMITLDSRLRISCGDRMVGARWSPETYSARSEADVERILSTALVKSPGGLKPIPPHMIEQVVKLHKLTSNM